MLFSQKGRSTFNEVKVPREHIDLRGSGVVRPRGPLDWLRSRGNDEEIHMALGRLSRRRLNRLVREK